MVFSWHPEADRMMANADGNIFAELPQSLSQEVFPIMNLRDVHSFRNCSGQAGMLPMTQGEELESATTPLKPKEGLNGPRMFLVGSWSMTTVQVTEAVCLAIESVADVAPKVG
jgi:hypothetical protein